MACNWLQAAALGGDDATGPSGHACLVENAAYTLDASASAESAAAAAAGGGTTTSGPFGRRYHFTLG
jgi:hypothetical protein